MAIAVTSLGGDAGRQQQVTDARGIVTKTDYDWLGRTLRTVEAFSAFNPSSSADKTTEYTYDGDNNMLTLKADQPGGAYETTQYVYGVTTGSGSNINSNDILAATQYPDPTTGNPSSSQQETYTVNALGDGLNFSDRNGNVHSYFYDVLGRQISDQVTTLGSGVDSTVLRIDTAYDTVDRPYLYTSYASTLGGSFVNQVQQAYNGLGQLITEFQSHSGAVNTGTTPKVQYGYVDLAGGVNNSRQTSMTYPNGRMINYNYNTGLDSNISRLSSISDSSATLEAYTYLGLDTVVKRAHPQPNVDLTYITRGGSGDGGDQYTGLDRFGRVVDQNWYNNGTSSTTDEFKYGYERDSNPLYRTNEVNHNFDELYHTNGAGNDYDNLNQLVAFARGVLNGTHDTISSPSRTLSWSLDALGNFSSVTTNGSTQSRSANQQNQITSISGQTTPGYDHNGNTTTDEQGHTLIYDAWNRLIQVKNGGTTLATYAYDRLGRRVVENHGSALDVYFSTAWQVVEEQQGGATQAQYVWDPLAVDRLVERDRGSERLYVQQDANGNVTALLDTSGNVKERYDYDPYGQVTFLNPSWGTLSSSAFAWIYLNQAERYDSSTGDYNERGRDYSPTLMRWLQNDPLGYGAGDTNLYRAEGDGPTDGTDPSGMADPQEVWRLIEQKNPLMYEAMVSWKVGIRADEKPWYEYIFDRSAWYENGPNFVVYDNVSDDLAASLAIELLPRYFPKSWKAWKDKQGVVEMPPPATISPAEGTVEYDQWQARLAAERRDKMRQAGTSEVMIWLDATFLPGGYFDQAMTVLGPLAAASAARGPSAGSVMARPAGQGPAKAPKGTVRTFKEKVAEFERDPSRWETISAHSDKASRKGARQHGSSTQTIYRNKDTGETIVRHTVTDDRGRVVDDHFRPDYKPRPGDLNDQ